MPRELELKVQLGAAELARLARDLPSDGLTVGPARSHMLRSIYFDTPNHDLQAGGMSRRLRQQGSEWLQTVKIGGPSANGLSNLTEIEKEVDGEKPDLSKIDDKKVRRAVKKVLKRAALSIFETIVNRTTREIGAENSLVELAPDDGEVRTDTDAIRACEAELELKSGPSRGLLVQLSSVLPAAPEGLGAGAAGKLSCGARTGGPGGAEGGGG